MSKEPKRNVYVGHRYVPKVMGEWDKAETYEGLSIVTNKGTSYTSKKRVPKGIDILNEEYWVVTGNYNAQIEEYRKDVSELEKEVGKKSDQSYVDNLNEKVTAQLAQIITINVKDFGAKGDGVTDDSGAILEAIEALPKTGGTLLFPPGKYIQGDGTSKEIGFIFDGYKNIKITGIGAIIEAHPENPPLIATCGFWFKHCENVIVEGITYDGRLDSRQANPGDLQAYNQQHAFNVWEGNKQITFLNVTAKRSMMDGFFVGANITHVNEPQNIVLDNCVADSNFRQGLSVVRVDGLRVIGGSYINTGRIKGTLPMAGIDVESNSNAEGQKNNGVEITGILAENNVGTGVFFHTGSEGSTLRNSRIQNNSGHGVATTSGKSRGCVIESNYIMYNGKNKGVDACDLYILGYNHVLSNNHIFSDGVPSLLLYGSTQAGVNGGGFVVKDNVFINANESLETNRGSGRIWSNGDVLFVGNTVINAIAPIGIGVESFAVYFYRGKNDIVKDNIITNSIPNNHTYGLRVNQGKFVINNIVEGYRDLNGQQIYIREKSLDGDVTLATQNYDSSNLDVSLGAVISSPDIANAPVHHNGRKIGFASSQPTGGTWRRGDIIFNSLPNVGSEKGWVCRTDGEPGNWVSLGTLQE